MYYVYIHRIKRNDTEFINAYATAEEAIEKIAQCYAIDKRLCQLGDYYYFMKQR